MAKKQVQVTIKGHVQGVFFRGNTRDRANRMGIEGWVKNQANGDVKAVFEGDEELLEDMIDWCHKGPPMARVDEVKTTWKEATGDFEEFRVKY